MRFATGSFGLCLLEFFASAARGAAVMSIFYSKPIPKKFWLEEKAAKERWRMLLWPDRLNRCANRMRPSLLLNDLLQAPLPPKVRLPPTEKILELLQARHSLLILELLFHF